MFEGILIGLGIGLPGGAILYYLYARKAIAAGKEYLGKLEYVAQNTILGSGQTVSVGRIEKKP